ncbi:DUF2431 domain-containing protein [Quillaja saponaria]|uniref:DUF2431 domain-containing protein n=1 Tax=Quillaja saponaria TaxID=32244 RepID=A0AAD7LSZ8_QUISA|nr:DUF2431 domain-containing protein [Quillaja saponaria]
MNKGESDGGFTHHEFSEFESLLQKSIRSVMVKENKLLINKFTELNRTLIGAKLNKRVSFTPIKKWRRCTTPLGYHLNHRPWQLKLFKKKKEEEMRKAKEVKWIKHYSSSHRILLVGECDFSFSLCMANAFGSDSKKMFSTSPDSSEQLMRSYEKAMRNVELLKKSGCKVMLGVDATPMAEHLILQGLKFDRIVFNFPYAAGRQKSYPREINVIKNQNANKLLDEDGEIHVTIKTAGFSLEWNIAALASLSGLKLVEQSMSQIGGLS